MAPFVVFVSYQMGGPVLEHVIYIYYIYKIRVETGWESWSLSAYL